VSAVLDVTKNIDEVLKRAEGVDFNDFNQASAFYRSFVGPRAEEWLDLLRYNSMLSSPTTHIVNTFSNIINSGIVAPVEKAVTGGLDFLSSVITGKEHKYFAGERGAHLSGYFSNIRTGFTRFAEAVSGERPVTNLDLRNIPVATTGAKGAVAKTLAYPMRLLEAADQFFVALTQGGERASLSYRASKGVNVTLPEIQALESRRLPPIPSGTPRPQAGTRPGRHRPIYYDASIAPK
jgi:hypothetical protein